MVENLWNYVFLASSFLESLYSDSDSDSELELAVSSLVTFEKSLIVIC